MTVLEKVQSVRKNYTFEIVIFSIITLVALLSFALGYTLAKDSVRAPIIIEKNSS